MVKKYILSFLDYGFNQFSIENKVTDVLTWVLVGLLYVIYGWFARYVC